jgi:SAM-dependent methyltransferase
MSNWNLRRRIAAFLSPQDIELIRHDLSELRGQVHSLLAGQQRIGALNDLSELRAQVQSLLAGQQRIEALNDLSELRAQVQSLLAGQQRIEALSIRSDANSYAVNGRLAGQSVNLNDVDLARFASVIQAGYTRHSQRIASRAAARAPVAPPPEPTRLLGFEGTLERLRALRPELFDTWLQLFRNGERGYYDLPLEASCSTWTNEFAWLFKHYVDTFGYGTVLDIGCGPRIMPAYLSAFDTASISAIEPLALSYHPPFHVERTVAEFLPWADASFDTAISGTSLDHVLSLRVALEEIRRVLKPGGLFINWLASLDGALPYDEHNAKPLDEFHLFQFHLDWALPLFQDYFDVVDVTRFRPIGSGFEHCFIVLRRP